MIFSLITSLISNTVCFLYPAYASYKALSLPVSSPDSERALERWLMYWAVVGSWTAVEAVIGWTFTWVPFYNIIKSLVFVFLALPQSEGASYIYRVHLAPFFQEHERDIDTFLASLRTRAGSAFVDGLSWLWAKVRTQLNIALPHEPPREDQVQGPYPGQPYPTPHMPAGHGPTLHDPASGLGRLYGIAARYAGGYMPVAVEALSQLANRTGPGAGAGDQDPTIRTRTTSTSAHFDTSQTMEMPIPHPTPAREPSDSSLRSRTFSHAQGPAGDQYGSLGRGAPSPINRSFAKQSDSQRSSSESIQSAASGDRRWAEGSYEQINKDDLGPMADGQASRPHIQGRRSSSNKWFGWGSGGEPRQKSD